MIVARARERRRHSKTAVLRQADTPTRLVREAIAATWTRRARGEREAEVHFMGLARALGRAGAPSDLQALALRASIDESRHVTLCAKLARAYGAHVDAPLRAHVAFEMRKTTAEGAALEELVALCCVGETLSVAAFGAILESAGPKEVRDVVKSILHDESFHAELGWTHLGKELALGRGEFLPERLPALFASSIPRELFAATPDLRDGPDAEQALAFGLLPSAMQHAILCDTFESVILPRFEAAGVETRAARAWLAERAAADPPSR
jgi:hypothetical protein